MEGGETREERGERREETREKKKGSCDDLRKLKMKDDITNFTMTSSKISN